MIEYIIIAVNYDNSKNYIMNTSPILWTNDISKAKIFDSLTGAKNELNDNFISLSATIYYTNITSVWICEYTNNIETRRERFI